MAWTTNWQGFFIADGSINGTLETLANVDTDDIFPMHYIEEKSWSSSPNFREEIKAYRDENTRNLTRITASGKKSSFSFDVRSGLHLKDKKKVQKFFTDRESDAAQRKVYLWYWNDENNCYKQGNFYRPNMEFTIKYVTATDIIYDKLKLEFVEY